VPTFDVVIVGGGPAGERAAIQAARAGKRVALVERQHVVGGTRINWGTIPSKTLRESALFVASLTRHKLHGIRCSIADELTVGELMYREQLVVQRELELVNASLARYAVEVIHGHGRFEDPHTLVVHSKDGLARLRLHGEIMIIATGTRPNRPQDVPFDGERVFDSDTILALPRMPRSMIVLGAGVIGVEYASIFAALGLEVTLIDTRPELLPYLDREMAVLLERELRRAGIILIHDDHYATIERLPAPLVGVRLTTRRGERFEADVLLYCVGRDGNTDDLGLDTLGIAPNSYGLLDVNEHFQTAIPHIYAVGDVIGYPALASTAMEQGRQAIRHAFGIPGPRGRTQELPFAIYAIPEVSYIGQSEEALAAEGGEYVVGYGRYDLNPRGQIIGAEGGKLKLLFTTPDLTLRGVHIVGAHASELIHVGQAFLKAQATAHEIAETLYNYPTLSDLYRHAAMEALGVYLRRQGHRREAARP